MKNLKQKYPILSHEIKESSHIEKIQYDTMMNNLIVHFKRSKKIYEFYEVSKDVWENFCKSESAGQFFNREIKNKFDYRLAGEIIKEEK